MNIIFLSEPRTKRSGPATWRDGLAGSLRRFGHNVRLVNIQQPSRFILNVRHIYRSDVVHCYGAGGLTVAFLLLAKLLKKRVIYTLHGDFKRESLNKMGLTRLFWLPLNYGCIQLANIITVPSRSLMDTIKLKVDSKKIIVIPNGIDPAKFLYDIDGIDTFKLVSITNFNHPQKYEGLLPLIKGFELARKVIPRLTLEIAGGGAQRRKFEDRCHIEGVSFLGFENDIPALLQHCGLYVHSSFLETFGYTVLEAMHYGVPVVVSNTQSLAEVAPSEALVEPTPEEFSKKIVNLLLHDKERSNLAMNCYNKSAEYYWPNITKQFLMLYQT